MSDYYSAPARSQRCGELEVDAVGIAEGQDRDAEPVQRRDVAVFDSGLGQTGGGTGQIVDRGHGEAEMVQSDAFGIEFVGRFGHRA